MAKKITDTEGIAEKASDLPADTVERSADTAEIPKSEDKVPVVKTEEKSIPKKVEQEIPEHAHRILKSFSGYRELYIDLHGGTFTVDTPPSFRTNATLYTNPYYRKP